MYDDKKQLSTECVADNFQRYRMLAVQVVVLGGLLSVGHLLGQVSKATSQDSPSTSNASVHERLSVPASPVTSKQTNATSNRRTTPRVATGKVDVMGQAVSVSCASCHANFQPDFELRTGDSLKQFHQGLKFSHGKLTCLTCHNAKNYNLLRLASQQSLEFAHAQTLCSQCHSKQSNDYERAAHGGMNGSWNALRGVRIRKQCIDCHDPHAPAFPAMIPTFKPHDRFLESKHSSHSGLSHE